MNCKLLCRLLVEIGSTSQGLCTDPITFLLSTALLMLPLVKKTCSIAQQDTAQQCFHSNRVIMPTQKRTSIFKLMLILSILTLANLKKGYRISFG